jgi:CubicO group peptidase (beta-lactamase class C family)
VDAGLAREIDRLAAETGFSGVVRVDRDGDVLARSYGLADRAHGIANTVDTRFAMASGSKGFTALVVMRLIEQGRLALDTTARSLLGEHLPLIADDVTVEHLLAHRSGIGDYLDEEVVGDVTDYVLRVPVHRLTSTEAFLAVVDGFPTAFPAGERFAYCNGGFIVLALLAERASGQPYHELVRSVVAAPAGLVDTGFLRLDALPATAAVGYVFPDSHGDRLRSNVLHLPVLASGDGGAFTTASDMRAFWLALFAGRIVSASTLAAMTAPRSVADDGLRYGLGFWLHRSGAGVQLEGMDAGVAFRSFHDPARDLTYTAVGNTSAAVWPIVKWLDDELG